MAVGSWDPDAEASAQPLELDPALLAQLIAYSERDQLLELDKLLPADDSPELSYLMKLDHSVWLGCAKNLADGDILHLIRFFAAAENLSGWEALEKSPAIPLAKTLRKRGVRLDKEFLQWLRTISSNRFLPYGPL